MIYLYPLRTHLAQILPDGGSRIRRFEEDLWAIFTSYTLPDDEMVRRLKGFFRQQASAILNDDRDDVLSELQSPLSLRRTEALGNLQCLHSVGLGGAKAQRAFAEVMCDVLQENVEAKYGGKWSPPSDVEVELRSWVENDYAGFIAETLGVLQPGDENRAFKSGIPLNLKRETPLSYSELGRWQGMGMRILGVLRTGELFDIVVNWDDTKGAIEDLRGFVTSPAARNYLTNTFNNAIAHRLLQPGASTIEILQVYIQIIRSFTRLDPKGVLLDRVSRPIRRYLRDRDDTVNIVVGGLLADPETNDEVEDSPSHVDALVELAIEMNKNSIIQDDEADEAEADFDDMNWNPDPVDAGPDYKKSSKNSDVIGSLISLFESKDAFVKEFQKILGERLLKAEYDFDREIRVLELLKLRFGEPALQACEVMLRDILDSRRVDASIQKDAQIKKTTIHPIRPAPTLHARILSHLFWPPLHAETFMVPPHISALQASYSLAFQNLKASRRLTWLHALGQVTVTLDLEDRTVTESVQTWQAAVIYAFEPDDDTSTPNDPAHPVTRSLSYLKERLSMSEPLVINALTFWIGKLVLKQSPPSSPTGEATYTVLETLFHEAAAHPGTASAAIAAAAETVTAAAAPAMLSEQEVAREKMDVYAQYVVGMLTNGGPMGLGQIVMMLKLTVPGGFPFGNEELKDFLEGEVRAGRLDYGGGTYKMAK